MDVADDGMELDERESLSEAREHASSSEAHEAKIKPSPRSRRRRRSLVMTRHIVLIGVGVRSA